MSEMRPASDLPQSGSGERLKGGDGIYFQRNKLMAKCSGHPLTEQDFKVIRI
jgi:hypothetical protein